MSNEVPDLSDQADETLVALAGTGESDDLVSARQDSTNLFASTGPDVLWTPKGGGKEPVAYSVLAHMEDSIRLSTSVRNNGNYDFQLNSRTTQIVGHEPGTLKGIKVPGYKKYSHAEEGADYVSSQGFANISHQDPAWINHPDPEPQEPQSPMTKGFVAEVADNTLTVTRPPGAQPLPNVTPPPSILSPNPSGPSGSFSPTGPGTDLYAPHSFSPLTPAEQQQTFDTWLKGTRQALKKSYPKRQRTGECKSKYHDNCKGRVNIYSTYDKYAPDLVALLMKKYNLSVDQAAGWVGNFGAESGGFTKVVEENPIHSPGLGFPQWTGGRAINFKKYIEQQTGHEPTNADYADKNLNMGFFQQETNAHYSGLMSDIQQGSAGTPAEFTPSYAQSYPAPWTSNVAGPANAGLANSTWQVYGRYEIPKDYQVGQDGNASEEVRIGPKPKKGQKDTRKTRTVYAYSSYMSRIRYAIRAKEDYLNKYGPQPPASGGNH